MDVSSENVEQDFLVYVVKEALSVNLNHPVVLVIRDKKTNSFIGMVSTAIRPEFITVRVLLTLVDGLQDGTNRILCHAINDSWDSERSCFMRFVRLRDEYSSNRLGCVGSERLFYFIS